MTVADQSDARDATAPSADDVAERAGPYVSRMLMQHLATNPDKRTWTGEGTAALVGGGWRAGDHQGSSRPPMNTRS